jgi:predicted nucleic acid-binding protein
MAIDALAVATAVRFGGGIVATHDPDDLRLLAGRHANVSILEI